MDIKKHIIDENSFSFDVFIELKDIDSMIDQKLVELSPKVRMAGFRPGKVPANIVRKKYYTDLYNETVSDMLKNATTKISKDVSEDVAYGPEIRDVKSEPGKDASFSLDIEYVPTFDTPDLTAIELVKPVLKIGEKELDQKLAELVKRTKLHKDATKTQKSETGDFVIINFEGFIDGKAFQGGKAENYSLELGSKSFIDNFEDQLVGKKAGDKVDVEVAFPKEYHAKDLADKKAVFKVEVVKIKKKVAAKADEELAKHYSCDSIDQLKDRMKVDLTSEFDQVAVAYVKAQIFNYFANKLDVPAPKMLLKKETELVTEALKHEKSAEATDAEQVARRRIKLGFVIGRIAKSSSIFASNEEVKRAALSRIYDEFGAKISQEIVHSILKNPSFLAGVQSNIIEDKVVALITQQCKATEKALSIEDIEKELDKLKA